MPTSFYLTTHTNTHRRQQPIAVQPSYQYDVTSFVLHSTPTSRSRHWFPLCRKWDRWCWCNQQFTMFIWIRMWHPFCPTTALFMLHGLVYYVRAAWPAVNARFEVQNHLSIIILLLSVNVAWNLLTSPMLISSELRQQQWTQRARALQRKSETLNGRERER